MAEAAQRLNNSVENTAMFGESAKWPPQGLDADASNYVHDYSRWLSGFAPAAGPDAA
jgi:hypothetical protein